MSYFRARTGENEAAKQRLCPLLGNAANATAGPGYFSILTSQHHQTADVLYASAIGDTETVIQQQPPYNGDLGDNDIHQGFVDNTLPTFPLYVEISAQHSGLNEFSEATGFHSFSGSNQCGIGQIVGWNQAAYPTNPENATGAASGRNDEQINIFGFTPLVSDDGSTPILGTSVGCSIADGTGYLGGGPLFFDAWGDASDGLLVPRAQFAVGGSRAGRMSGEFMSDFTLHTGQTSIDEGQPIAPPPIMQLGATTSLRQTHRTPLHPTPAGVSKRRQRGGIPCPEGCGTTLSRRYDIDRHVAQKHAEATLRCPADGCAKLFSRPDKRLQHLKQGHKLSDKDIDMLFAANLGGEKM